MAEAGGFSAKSLRTGGTSESAALEIREGVMQGHGGWAARKSLDSYDQMKGTKARVVSHALNEAVLAPTRGASGERLLFHGKKASFPWILALENHDLRA